MWTDEAIAATTMLVLFHWYFNKNLFWLKPHTIHKMACGMVTILTKLKYNLRKLAAQQTKEKSGKKKPLKQEKREEGDEERIERG